MLVFRPLEDFESREFMSVYLKGLSYTVRDGNDKLMTAVAQWLKEGKVTLQTPEQPIAEARVKGEGMVITPGDVTTIKAEDIVGGGG